MPALRPSVIDEQNGGTGNVFIRIKREPVSPHITVLRNARIRHKQVNVSILSRADNRTHDPTEGVITTSTGAGDSGDEVELRYARSLRNAVFMFVKETPQNCGEPEQQYPAGCFIGLVLVSPKFDGKLITLYRNTDWHDSVRKLAAGSPGCLIALKAVLIRLRYCRSAGSTHPAPAI
jgi:hypothetical protein